ncbi:MAG TPA: polysaccharide deacetylase family protein [Anaerolineae bacterium]|nr:polysaccharide deacetylase family protein [Anaerolineae bacterium]
MAEWHEDDSIEARRKGGLPGWIVLLALVLFLLGAVYGRTSSATNPTPQTTSVPAAALVTITPSLTPSLTPTLQDTPTLMPTATNTHTPIPTPTHTPTSTPTNTPAAAAPLPPGSPTPLPTTPPLPTPNGVYSWTLKVPILMYHYISVPPEGADKYRVNLSVEPDRFREQMQYLADNGYTTIDLYDLIRAITNKEDLPDKPIILTFDDGYKDIYENAWPIMQEFGFTGTFFIPTEFIDIGYEPYMTWEMLEELAANGNRIEPHSRSHPDLRGLSREALIWQMLGPQETIAAHTGYRPRFFGYPSGRYDEDTIQLLKELDFWGAVTTQGGTWHGFEDRYEWTRVRIWHGMPMDVFADRVDLNGTIGGKFPP